MPHDRRGSAFDRSHQHFFGPRRGKGCIARYPFLQQQLDPLDHRLGVEPPAQAAVLQGVGDGGDGHALMMRHETAHNHMARPFRQTRGREIQRLVKTEPACAAKRCKRRIIPHRRLRINHRRQPGGIGCDHPVLAQAAFQPQPRHPEVGILIGHLGIAGIVGGF